MTAQDPSAADPLVALTTVEGALVTLVGAMLAATPGLSEFDRALLEAIQCEDEAHWHLLSALGGLLLTDAFTVPSALLQDRANALRGLLLLKEVSLGAEMAFSRSLVAGADQRVAETLFAMGAIEGGHHAALRAALGEQPTVARAFLPWQFSDPAEAIEALSALGVLGGAGELVPYPGPLPRRCRGVTGLVPETTEDATAWGG